MAHGKTTDMIVLSRIMKYRPAGYRPKVVRDRSLNGKDRIRARKAANRG